MRTLLLILTIATIGGCCKEKECVQSYLSIGAIRFSKSELDTVVVKRFNRGGMTPVDSLQLALEKNSFHHAIGRDTTIIFIIEPIDYIKAGFDYKISFPGAARVVTVTDFTEIQGTWKDCPATSKTPCRTQIAYKSNGIVTSSETLWVNR
jgi:hypothetical protein